MATEEEIISIGHGQNLSGGGADPSEVDFSINKGEFVYLIGKTGSGKSSLLKTLYGELPLRDGTGNVAGYDLKKLKRRKIPKLRRNIGIVFQDFQLLMDRNVHKNLEIRATSHRLERQKEN